MTSLTGTVSGAGLAFLAIIVAARTLSLSDFAAFGVGLAVHSLTVQLADAGLGTVTVTETARDWQGNRPATDAKLRTLGRRRLLISVSIAVALFLVALALPELGAYRDVVLIGCGGAVFASVQLFLVAVLQSAARYRAAGLAQALTGGARLVLVAGGAAAGLELVPLMLAYAVLAPAAGAAYALAALARRGEQGAPRSRDRAPVDRRMARAMIVVFVAAALTNNVDVLILVLFADEADLAAYVAAWRVAAGVLLISTAFSAGLLPSVMQADDVALERRRLLRVGTGVAAGFLVATPLVTIAGLALMGEAGEGAATALVLLLIAFSLQAFVQTLVPFYLRIGRPWLVAGVAVTQLTVMTAVTAVALPLGAEAPALGQAAAALVGVISMLVQIIARPARPAIRTRPTS
jgi:O-antigen/teichoic acid export membrane protein